MKPAVRLGMLALLVAGGAALWAALYDEGVRSPLRSTLTSAFQLLGTPVKLVDRVASRVVPVSSVDEAALGEVFRSRYDAQVKPGDADQAYLDSLLGGLRPYARKPFAYRAYVVGHGSAPNAMAFPGGVILVTRELLKTVQSESELVAVLAHELGHIELGHCFDTVRFQLLAKKAGAELLGAVADSVAQLLLRHAYSKATEHEADEYAYTLLENSRYDPLGVGGSFHSLLRRRGPMPRSHQRAEPFRDYFMSHPPLEVREAEFRARAMRWWSTHRSDHRNVGVWNLVSRRPLATDDLREEWVSRAGS